MAAATGGWQAVRLVNMEGGRDTLVPPDLLGDNESPDSEHVDLQLKGIVRPCFGKRRRYAANFAAAGVVGMGVYYPQNGVSKILAGVGGAVYADTPHLAVSWATQTDFQRTGSATSKTITLPVGGGAKLQAMTWADAQAAYTTWGGAASAVL